VTTEARTLTKEDDRTTGNTESVEKKETFVNEIITDGDTNRIDLSNYVSEYDEESGLEKEEIQHTKVEQVIEEEEETIDEKNQYHTVKDNIVNKNPEEDEEGINQV